jgi:hypothetical protein
MRRSQSNQHQKLEQARALVAPSGRSPKGDLIRRDLEDLLAAAF